MGLISGFVHDASGNAIVAASVYVYTVDTTTAVSLYSDRGLATPAANPLTTASDGTYRAYAVDGIYDLKITAVGHPDTTIPDVPVIDPTLSVLLGGRPVDQVVSGSTLGAGKLVLRGSATATPGTVEVRDSAFVFNEEGADQDARFEGDTLTHMLFADGSAATENLAFVAAAAPNWQTMDRGLFVGDASAPPTGNPSAGVFLYSESGAWKWRNGNGNVVYPDYGSYTPTITGVTNVAASTSAVCYWTRTGPAVTVWGQIIVDPTATAYTQFRLSLPIASNFTLAGQLSGNGHQPFGGASIPIVGIQADTTNDQAIFELVPQDTANRPIMFHFSYQVL